MLRTVDFGLPKLSLVVAGKNGDRPLLRHLEAADSGGIVGGHVFREGLAGLPGDRLVETVEPLLGVVTRSPRSSMAVGSMMILNYVNSLMICFARTSSISLCLGTGCFFPVLGLLYRSCLLPCLTRTHPSDEILLMRSFLFIQRKRVPLPYALPAHLPLSLTSRLPSCFLQVR